MYRETNPEPEGAYRHQSGVSGNAERCEEKEGEGRRREEGKDMKRG